MPVEMKLSMRNEIFGFSLFLNLDNSSENEEAKADWSVELPSPLEARQPALAFSGRGVRIAAGENLQVGSWEIPISQFTDAQRKALSSLRIKANGTIHQATFYVVDDSKEIELLRQEANR